LREVVHGSPEYDACVELRRRLLRIPLGLNFTAEELALESRDVHLGAFQDDRCVGTLVLTRIDDECVQMRQVGVDDCYQGLGIGRAMVEWSEQKARALGYSKIVLHARDTAVPFYENLDYETVGEPYVEVTIPHRTMVKLLPQS
jgi:GNAT superfamily N-acetyltransferase